MQQSPFASLLSEDRTAQTLKLMALPKNRPLTFNLAREVCERTGSTVALLSPVYSTMGGRITIPRNVTFSSIWVATRHGLRSLILISPCRGWPEKLDFRRVIFRLPRRALPTIRRDTLWGPFPVALSVGLITSRRTYFRGGKP